MTKRESFNALLAISEVASNTDLVAFINHELELLDKKNTQKKPSAKSIENASRRDALVSLLTHEPQTIAQILENAPESVSGLSVTSVAGLFRGDPRVVRTEIKRKSYYSLA